MLILSPLHWPSPAAGVRAATLLARRAPRFARQMSLHHRVSRILAAIGISSSLLLGTLAGPMAVFGARASAIYGATALPSAVTPGANVAFDVRFELDPNETSKLSQLYMSALTPSGATLLEVEAPGPSQGTCTVGVNLSCSFGAVAPGDVVTLRVVYTTPPSGSSMTVNFDFNTTGVAADRKGNSHGDAYRAVGTVTLDSSKDFAGAYTSASGQVVSDSQALHSTRNPQFTAVNSPSGAIAVFVSESNEVDCPTGYTSCFGQWSHITVDYGATIDGGFSVILGYKGNIGNANFIHVLDDGSLEPITETCSSKTAPATSELPCKWIETASGNTYATLWLTENGRIKAY